MPIVQDQHERAASAAALFDQSSNEAVKRAPGHCAAGTAVDAFDIRMARTQGRQVDADAAAARHDLGHLRQRRHDAFARIQRRRDDITVVVGQILVGAGRGQDAPAGHKLPVIQQPAEFAAPFQLTRGVGFCFGDAAGDAVHHLGGIGLQRFIDMFQVARQHGAIQQDNADLRQVNSGDFANLALSRGRVEHDDDSVANGQAVPGHILLRITIEEDFVAELVQGAGFGIGVFHDCVPSSE